ncbi:hypothetical protein JOB18_038153 [Solea senegalensis]|uniref:Uncharacterized protein n=1 Tax=Solea senegalensis TaxID=28829 RepID=A0AAV6RQ67_SOLSE|nr:hypothetical protein JOB18_038153 [Solea senegalensis]
MRLTGRALLCAEEAAHTCVQFKVLMMTGGQILLLLVVLLASASVVPWGSLAQPGPTLITQEQQQRRICCAYTSTHLSAY